MWPFKRKSKKRVIALVASMSAGKTTVVKFLQKYDFRAYRLSDEIRASADDLGLDSEDREVLQDLGNKLRIAHGDEYLAVRGVESMGNYNGRLVFDGVRNPAELEFLKKTYGEELLVIGVISPLDNRLARVRERQQYKGDEVIDKSHFEELDEAENKSANVHGQRISDCLEHADLIIANDSDLESFEEKVEAIRKEYFA